MELKLASCLDAENNPAVLDRHGKPYLSTDSDHLGAACLGRGEVRDTERWDWIERIPVYIRHGLRLHAHLHFRGMLVCFLSPLGA